MSKSNNVVQFNKSNLTGLLKGKFPNDSSNGFEILKYLTREDIISGQILSCNRNGGRTSVGGISISMPFDDVMNTNDCSASFFKSENLDSHQTSVFILDFDKIKSVEQIPVDGFNTWGSYALLVTIDNDATFVIAFDFK